jgi:hypothetical protein
MLAVRAGRIGFDDEALATRLVADISGRERAGGSGPAVSVGGVQAGGRGRARG